jgi:hypothetical protein
MDCWLENGRKKMGNGDWQLVSRGERVVGILDCWMNGILDWWEISSLINMSIIPCTPKFEL